MGYTLSCRSLAFFCSSFIGVQENRRDQDTGYRRLRRQQPSSLAGFRRCVGDIGNNNGALHCNLGKASQGREVAPAATEQPALCLNNLVISRPDRAGQAHGYRDGAPRYGEPNYGQPGYRQQPSGQPSYDQPPYSQPFLADNRLAVAISVL
jgi:hypothetical protein